jgi:hypothetical protein
VGGTRRAGAPGRWWTARGAPPAIYGTVIGGAVMASVEEHTPVDEVAVAVLVTLVIYWAAERWSQVLGSQVAGEPLNRRRVAQVFADGWPMVQVSYLPLVIMLLANVCGADADLSVNIALGSIVALLIVFGATGGRRAGLTGLALIASAVLTGALGLALIVLKSLLG